jgi:(4S)-4-hydroxy-5-phosphonooxypentane-2,3-dione isomerase
MWDCRASGTALSDEGETSMLKSVAITSAVTFGITAWLLFPMRTEHAAAQPAPLYINLVELDIVPAEMDKFMIAIKENGAASVREPGCRMFNIAVSSKDPNHVLLFEVYDNAAALDSHRTTDHFKKYQATTANMVAKRDVRAFSSAAMNVKGM